MSIYEQLPAKIQQRLQETTLFQAKADIDEEGKFGERWFVITNHEAIVLTADGETVRTLSVSQVTEARAVGAIGGGSLVADTKDGPVVLVRYTAARTPMFSLAAKILSALTKGEEIPVASAKDFPRVCEKCKNPLPEGTQVCPSCMDKGKVIMRLLSYARPYKLQMTVAAVMMIIVTLIELVPPFIVKVIVDDVLQPKDLGQTLLWLVIGLAATHLVLTLMQIARGYIGVWVGGKLMGDIRRDTYQSLMSLSLAFFDRRQTSQFIGRVNSDSEAMRQFMTDGVIWISGQVLMLVAIVGMMFNLSWKLALFAIIPTPFILLGSMTIWPLIRHRWYRHWRSVNHINMLVADALQGIRVVKAFGQERAEKKRYGTANADLVVQTIRMEGMWQGVFPIFALLTSAGGTPERIHFGA